MTGDVPSTVVPLVNVTVPVTVVGSVSVKVTELPVVDGLADGTIDAIVSDHRPQDQDSKRVPFAQAMPGGKDVAELLGLYHNLLRMWSDI